MSNNRSYLLRALLGLQYRDLTPFRLRNWVLRRLGGEIATDAFMEAGVSVVAGPLSLGRRAYVNRGCHLDCRGGVSIGPGTLLGPRVVVLTASHPVQPRRPRAGPVTYAPVNIGEGAWIGAGATILPGVRVGDGCVVAAGAVVTGDLADDGLYAGVPARLKRRLDADGSGA